MTSMIIRRHSFTTPHHDPQHRPDQIVDAIIDQDRSTAIVNNIVGPGRATHDTYKVSAIRIDQNGEHMMRSKRSK